MNENEENYEFAIYLGSSSIDETLKMIEEEGWDAGEIFYEDLKDFYRNVGSGTAEKGDYEYMRDLLTFLINKEDYWQVSL